MNRLYRPSIYSKGFSLVEILFVLLILSIGLLGIASLEIKSLQQTEQSYAQSLMQVQLTDISERLRANHGIAARQKECQAWQQQTHSLLSGIQIDCHCQENSCQVNMAWKSHTVSQLLKF